MKRYDIAVLGAGESGTGAAVLAKKQGYRCWVSDVGIIKKKYNDVLLLHEIDFETGQHNLDHILNSGLIIKSPGIPDNIQMLAVAREKGIKIISEIEFAGRFTNAKKICITGSNGKTTTSLLTYQILKNAGLNVGIAGNIGDSFALQVANSNVDYYVLEISSFQLDGMYDFKAEIAVLLNITPDHLDRYDHQFSKYANSKFRIFQNQSDSDSFIFNMDDGVIASEINKRNIRSGMYPFSIKQRIIADGACLNNNKIEINVNSNKLIMTLEELALQGKHNVYNSMAAGIASRLVEIRKDVIKESLSDFQHIEHRLESVASIHGIEFINDSKATNVNSTWYALESIRKKIIWIAGGQDKGNDYSSLEEIVRDKVKAIICLGTDNRKLKKAFADDVETIVETQSMQEAIRTAYYLANKGEVVLLSPACASFDLFEDYQDRGNRFKEAVNKL